MSVLYDQNSTEIEESKQLISQMDGKRLRVFLDIVSTCFGNCSGCALSFAERKDVEPEMTPLQVKDYLKFFIPIINKKYDNNQLFTTVINFGTGDYFSMKQEFLEELFKETSDFFNQIKTPRNVMTISTSLFMGEDKMSPKIEAMQKYLRGNQFAVDAVIDPTVLDIHYEKYLKNYSALIKKFPFFDLVINMSNHVQVKDIKNLMNFLKELNVLSFDIQYALNKTNTYRVKVEKEKFALLMKEIEENVEDKERVLGYNLAIPKVQINDENTIFSHIRGQAKDIVNERFVVKGNGDVYPIAFGFGDIILDEKFDMLPIANVKQSEFDEEKAIDMVSKFLVEIFKKNKVCHTCEFSAQCYSTGYSFYNKFSTNPKECQNVGVYIFQGIKNQNWLTDIEKSKIKSGEHDE